MRDRIAHAVLDSGEPTLSADEDLDMREIYKWLALMKCIVRHMLKSDFPKEFLPYLNVSRSGCRSVGIHRVHGLAVSHGAPHRGADFGAFLGGHLHSGGAANARSGFLAAAGFLPVALHKQQSGTIFALEKADILERPIRTVGGGAATPARRNVPAVRRASHSFRLPLLFSPVEPLRAGLPRRS